MNEMTPEQKLEILTTAIKAECERLCQSQEPGITDMRYRLEDALLRIGVKPYATYPIQVFETICLQDAEYELTHMPLSSDPVNQKWISDCNERNKKAFEYRSRMGA